MRPSLGHHESLQLFILALDTFWGYPKKKRKNNSSLQTLWRRPFFLRPAKHPAKLPGSRRSRAHWPFHRWIRAWQRTLRTLHMGNAIVVFCFFFSKTILWLSYIWGSLVGSLRSGSMVSSVIKLVVLACFVAQKPFIDQQTPSFAAICSVWFSYVMSAQLWIKWQYHTFERTVEVMHPYKYIYIYRII